MVKKVTVERFEDRFGKQHDTMGEAVRAEAYADLIEALNSKYSAYGEMEVDDLPRFIEENADVVRRFLESKLS